MSTPRCVEDQDPTQSRPEKQTCLATVYAAHVPSGFLRFGDRKRRHQTCQKNKTQHCSGAMGTSTWAIACAFSSQPQPLLCACPPVLSHGHKNLLNNCGVYLLSNDLHLSSPALLFSESPCRRFVSIVAVTVATSFSVALTSGAWSVLRSSSVRFQEVGEISTSSEYQRCRRSQVRESTSA